MSEQDEEESPVRHTLSILSIMKNEDDNLEEWLDHYIAEGVDHFYLIDNDTSGINPTTGEDRAVAMHRILSKYTGRITFVLETEKYAHLEHLASMVPRVRSEWLIVVDLDEFIYSRGSHRTVKDYLLSLEGSTTRISQVIVPWKMFGSSGHIKQPDSVTRGFARRQEVSDEGVDQYVKAIIRPADLISQIHHHWNMVRGATINADGTLFSGGGRVRWFWNTSRKRFDKSFLRRPARIRITAQALADSHLHCNHYCIQSRDWYDHVKCQRGDSVKASRNGLRTLSLFEELDRDLNAEEDLELIEKRSQASPM